MMKKIQVGVFLTIGLAVSGLSSLAAGAPRMAFPGVVDTNDASYPSKLGKGWWALCQDDSTTTLKAVKIKAKSIEPKDETYRYQIEADRCSSPVLLVKNKNWAWLKEGPLETAKIIGEQPDQEIHFGDQKIFIREKEDGERFRGVYLEVNGKSHRIFGLNEQTWNLKWAGDLDHDGKIDLLISFTNVEADEDDGHPQNSLFLSSAGNDLTPVYPVVKATE